MGPRGRQSAKREGHYIRAQGRGDHQGTGGPAGGLWWGWPARVDGDVHVSLGHIVVLLGATISREGKAGRIPGLETALQVPRRCLRSTWSRLSPVQVTSPTSLGARAGVRGGAGSGYQGPAWQEGQAGGQEPRKVHTAPPPQPRAQAAHPPSAGSLTAGRQQRCRAWAAPSGRAGAASTSPRGPLPPLLQRRQPLLPGQRVLGPRPVGRLGGRDVDLRVAGGAGPCEQRGEPAGTAPAWARWQRAAPIPPGPEPELHCEERRGDEAPRPRTRHHTPTSDDRAGLRESQAQVVLLLLGGGAGRHIHISGRLSAGPLGPRGSCGERAVRPRGVAQG